MSSAMPLTFPVLLCVASKDIIPTFDNHHSWSLAIAERVKVGGCPAITRGAIYQGVGVASTCQRVFQPTGQGLAVLCGQNNGIFKGAGFELINDSLDLVKLSFS